MCSSIQPDIVASPALPSRNEVLTSPEREAIESAFAGKRVSSGRNARLRRIAWNVIGVIIFLLLWEAVPRLIPKLNLLMFPPPSGVVEALIDLVTSGAIFVHMGYSFMRALGGFAIGSTLGVIVGIITGRLGILQHLSDPVLHGLRAIPAIAFVPLSIAWFGLGETAKIFLIAWGTFFPVWVNTMIGVREIPVVYIRSALSMGASPWSIMTRVVLPAALPFIIAGLRLATSIALVSLVAAELVGSSEGLGYLISFSHLVFRIDMMFVGLLALGVLGFTMDRLFLFIVHRCFPWYQGEGRR